jgi:hypothetical protein
MYRRVAEGEHGARRSPARTQQVLVCMHRQSCWYPAMKLHLGRLVRIGGMGQVWHLTSMDRLSDHVASPTLLPPSPADDPTPAARSGTLGGGRDHSDSISFQGMSPRTLWHLMALGGAIAPRHMSTITNQATRAGAFTVPDRSSSIVPPPTMQPNPPPQQA